MFLQQKILMIGLKKIIIMNKNLNIYKGLVITILLFFAISLYSQSDYINRYEYLCYYWDDDILADTYPIIVFKYKQDGKVFYAIEGYPYIGPKYKLKIENQVSDIISYMCQDGLFLADSTINFDNIVEADETLCKIYTSYGIFTLINHCIALSKKGEMTYPSATYLVYLCWINDIVIHIPPALNGYLKDVHYWDFEFPQKKLKNCF